MKGKKVRLIVISVVTLILVSTIGGVNFASAATNPTIAEMEIIAKNVPNYIHNSNKWNSVSVLSVRPLVDFNDKLVAYNVDIKNNKTNETAYVVISVNKNDGPILEYAEGKPSQYDKLTINETGVYNGIFNYAKKTKDNKHYDITKGNAITVTEENSLKDSDKNKQLISAKPEKAQQLRNVLASTSTVVPSGTVLKEKILEGVPDYVWYRGCSPTSAAMILKYDYADTLTSVSSSALIDKLANAMGTDANGGTSIDKIPTGIQATMAAYGQNATCRNGSELGKTANTVEQYTAQIDNNLPLVASVIDSTETAPSYPDGFGNHSMAGVGYQLTTYTNYIIVHDTGVDGNVWCDYDSSALGEPLWTYINK